MDLLSASKSIVDHDRGEAERRLVEEQEPRAGHEGAAEREHLLLAAAQRPGALRGAVGEDGEQLVDAREPPLAPARAPRR